MNGLSVPPGGTFTDLYLSPGRDIQTSVLSPPGGTFKRFISPPGERHWRSFSPLLGETVQRFICPSRGEQFKTVYLVLGRDRGRRFSAPGGRQLKTFVCPSRGEMKAFLSLLGRQLKTVFLHAHTSKTRHSHVGGWQGLTSGNLKIGIHPRMSPGSNESRKNTKNEPKNGLNTPGISCLDRYHVSLWGYRRRF